MKLSKRLNALYALVKEDDIIADIGCDHAQLCCRLVSEKNIAKAYACDVAQGPLLQAQKNIEHYNLQDRIQTVLSDGLDNLAEDVTCIVVAGMGFETVCQILDKNIDKLKKRRCIIQVNRDVEGLRKWISDHHYHIQNEFCVLDEHYYQIIEFDTTSDQPLVEKEIIFGRRMKHDFDFYSNWKFNLSKYEKILRGLEMDHSRYQEVLSKMIMIYELFGS